MLSIDPERDPLQGETVSEPSDVDASVVVVEGLQLAQLVGPAAKVTMGGIGNAADYQRFVPATEKDEKPFLEY